MADYTINDIIKSYLSNNNLFNNYNAKDYKNVERYQSSIKSIVLDKTKLLKTDTKQINTKISPLNNINFIGTLDNGFSDKYVYSSFILLSSLYSNDVNKLFIDKENLITLFKSGIGIIDLPYTLVLYLGGLHYFNKNKPDGTLGGLNFIDIANDLDNNVEKILDLTNSSYTEYINSGFSIQNIQIINDFIYKPKCDNKTIIPKFGYGTYSEFMENYYNFISDRSGNNNVYDSVDPQHRPFHIRAAEDGFVKSFKSYSGDINFMGHYTILKNKYIFNSNITNDIILSSFKKSIQDLNITITYPSLVSLSTGSVMSDLFLLYSKIKTNYLYNTTDLNNEFKLNSLITDLNSVMTLNMKYKYIGDDISCDGIGIFSYIIFKLFFGVEQKIYTSFVDLYGGVFNNNTIENSKTSLRRNKSQTEHKKLENDFLTKFLLFYWDKELEYINRQNNSFDSNGNNTNNLLVMLYPSAGGIFYPNNLFPGKNGVDYVLTNKITNKQTEKDLVISLNNPCYLILDNETIKDIPFDNRSVIENSTRILWYDTANYGTQLCSNDPVDNGSTLSKKIFTTDLKENIFTNINKSTSGLFDLFNKNTLTIQELYSIIDIEKFEYFEKLFIEFSTRYSDDSETNYTPENGNDWIFQNNNDGFSFETLIKSLTTVGENDINIIDDKLLKDDLIYLLNGYSSYNYNFCDTYGISKVINAALTQAQYNKNELSNGTFNEFLSQKLSVNNYSNIGPVSLIGLNETLYTNYQNFIFRPDVIFGNITESMSDELIRYYIKKLIFGDIQINNFSHINYIIPFNITEKINTYIGDSNKNYSDYISTFFRFLDIELNDNNFYILYNLFIENIKNGSVKNTPFSNKVIDYTSLIKKYLNDFIYNTYTNNISGLNLYLTEIKEKLNTESQSTVVKSKTDNNEDYIDFKTNTYYNIKNIYDKYISYQPEQITPIKEKYNEYSDLTTSTGEFNNINGMLFYNYLYKDLMNSDSSSSIYDKKTPKHLAEYVQIVDRSNNDVGGDILIDVIALSNDLELKFNGGSNDELTKKSVYNIFDTIAQHNEFLLHPINSYVGYFDNLKNPLPNYVDNIFGLHNTTERIDSNPAFILQWGNHTSSFDEKVNNKSHKSLSNSFSLDIDPVTKRVSNQTNIPNDILSKGSVTSFVVDFGNKSQGMFKNIQLNTSEFSNTEESINAYVNLIGDGEKDTNKIASGNIFKLMESRSYTCQVESMGNALIQPLTYFYLKNVPLFKGAYWITNVEHNISSNNMITTFKGVRQPVVSKTNNRSDVLKSIEKTLNIITNKTNQISTSNTTSGPVTQERDNITKDNPYGTFHQQLSESYGYVDFNGIDILSSLLYSEFGSTTDLFKMVLMTFYNRAKYWANTQEQSITPSTVIKYMVDVALSFEINYNDNTPTPLFGINNVRNNGSLTKLTTEFKVDQSNDIFITLVNLTNAKTTSDVIKILKPTNLLSQKLSISLIGGDYRDDVNGNPIFYVGSDSKSNALPKIIYSDIDNTVDFSNYWKSYSIIYMKTILSLSGKDKIYTSKVNNENVSEFELLNNLSYKNLKVGDTHGGNTYLGCFDKDMGITFIGNEYNEKSPDNYVVELKNNSPSNLLKQYKNTLKPITISTTITQLITLAGFNPNSPIGVMAGSIAIREGYVIPKNNTKGNLAYRNNNPGNLVYSSEYQKYDLNLSKITTTDNDGKVHTWALFSKPEYGMKALIDGKIKKWASGNMPLSGKENNPQIFSDWDKGIPPSFLQFFYTYAPPKDKNDTIGYTTSVVNTINKSFNKDYTVNSKVKEVIS